MFGTFVLYADLVFHIARPPGRVVRVAAYIGRVLAGNPPAILASIAGRSVPVDSVIGPVDYLASYLFASYFLLVPAYLEARRNLAREPPRANPIRIPVRRWPEDGP